MEELIDKVIAQILEDIGSGDTTCLAELLNSVPRNVLEAYLPGEKE